MVRYVNYNKSFHCESDKRALCPHTKPGWDAYSDHSPRQDTTIVSTTK